MRRRVRIRMIEIAISCLALLSGWTPAAETPARAGGVQSGEVAPGPLEPRRAKAAEIPSMKGVDLSGAWKVLWGTLGISGLAFAAVLLRRKYGSRAWRAPAGEGLQILARTALSPRHHVFVLRFSDRKVLVGVSGDRMVPLAVIEDGTSRGSRLEGMVPERGTPERAVPERGFSERGAPERGNGSSRRSVSDADLMPYRRQVDRLRDLLRGRQPASGREE